MEICHGVRGIKIATTVGVFVSVCRGQYMFVDDGKYVYVLLCVCKFWKVFVGAFMCIHMLAGTGGRV